MVIGSDWCWLGEVSGDDATNAKINNIRKCTMHKGLPSSRRVSGEESHAFVEPVPPNSEAEDARASEIIISPSKKK